MNATTTRGRRVLAVLATTSTLILPAVGASAAPAEQADGRAGDGTSEEWTEDNDTNDGGTPDDVADDGDNAHPSGRDRSVEHGDSGNQGRATSDPDDDGRGPDRSNGGPDEPNGAGGVDQADQDGNNGCGNDDDFEDDNEGWCGRNPERGPDVETAGVEQDVEEDAENGHDVTDDCPEGQEMVDGECAAGEVASDDATGHRDEDDCPTGASMGADGTGATVGADGECGTTRVNPVSTTTPAFEVPQPTLEGVLGERIDLEDDAPETAVLGVTFTNEVDAATTGGILAAALPAQDGAELAVAADALPRTGAGLAGLAAFGLSALAGGTALSRRRR